MKQDTSMINFKVNWPAIDHAKRLISSGKINCKDSVGEPEPIIVLEEKFLQDHSLEEYANWFFALNENIKSSDKHHYEFPLGDFNFIFRENIISAKKHSEMNKFDEGIMAAEELLVLIEKKCLSLT